MNFAWIPWLTLIAAIISAVFAVLSYFRSRNKDKIALEISDTIKEYDEIDRTSLYHFTIENLSNRPVIISAIKIYKDGEEIFDTAHNPSPEKIPIGISDIFSGKQNYLEHQRFGWDSEIFEDKAVLQPNESVNYSYYLIKNPDRIDVSLTSPIGKNLNFDVNFEPNN